MAAANFIYLASQSPRRRDLLQQIGVAFRLLPCVVDEAARSGETASAYVARIAKLKACTASHDLALGKFEPRPILTADTCVALGRVILGKPKNAAAAAAMLRALSGRTHRVITSVAMVREQKLLQQTVITKVSFRTLSRAEITRYIASGEAQDKAGAYAIQGLGATFVSCIEGSYSNVVGLPLFETAALLKSFGVSVL